MSYIAPFSHQIIHWNQCFGYPRRSPRAVAYILRQKAVIKELTVSPRDILAILGEYPRAGAEKLILQGRGRLGRVLCLYSPA